MRPGIWDEGPTLPRFDQGHYSNKSCRRRLSNTTCTIIIIPESIQESSSFQDRLFYKTIQAWRSDVYFISSHLITCLDLSIYLIYDLFSFHFISSQTSNLFRSCQKKKFFVISRQRIPSHPPPHFSSYKKADIILSLFFSSQPQP